MINKININTVEKHYNPTNNEFVNYKVSFTNNDLISFVPVDEANTDYQTIQQWIADGGTVIDNGGGE
tara:strand:+ start:3329 stop:3529 length:201 start_codon:yes stop_codon:yes gene_type:complete